MAAKLRHPFRPYLEALEDRRVPATFTVKNLLDNGNDLTPIAGSLRAAIKAGNDNGPGLDIIVFKPGLEGTIPLAGTAIPIMSSLVLAGPGAAKITVDGGAASGIFFVDDSLAALRNVTIKGLTLFNGSAPDGGAIASAENLTVVQSVITGNRAAGKGGGIYQYDGNLTLRRTTLAGNTATQNGGGVFAAPDADRFVIDRSMISNNSAGFYGDGLYTQGGLTTITSSKITHNTAGSHGGGLYSSAPLVIDRTTISGNVARTGRGGGLVQDAFALTLTNSTVSGNRAATDGGGLQVYGTTSATIRRCTVAYNSATGNGGGLFSANNALMIDRSVISGNTATGPSVQGGGIYQYGGYLKLRNSTINSNRVPLGHGGGIYLGHATADSAISSCTLFGNEAQTGAGLNAAYQTTAALLVQNTTISGNRAALVGGGISVGAISYFTLRHSTIAFNQANNTAGGLYALSSGVTVENTIVANNTATNGPDVAGFASISVRFSLIRNSVGSMLNIQSGVIFNEDPLLAPLATNGGPTQTHALKKGSPAINKGLNSAAGSPFDQRGAPFKRKVGGAVDMGAFERQ